MNRLKLEYLSEENRDEWNKFVDKMNEGCFYHRYEWLKTLEKGLGLEAVYILIRKDSNIIGVFPNFVEKIEKTPFKELSSIPMSYGGPLILKDKKSVIEMMLKEIEGIGRKKVLLWHRISTTDLKYTQYASFLSDKGYFPSLDNCKFVIDIQKPYPEIEKSFSSGRRRNIKKSGKSKYSIENMEITLENLKIFYDLYVINLKRLGVGIRPFSLFEEIYNNLKNQTKLFVVKDQSDNCIAGLLNFIENDKSTIYYYFGGADKNCFKYYPNELLHEYSIKWGIKNNYKFYDMGGTRSSFDDGIFKFKEEFGGQLYPNITWIKPYSRIKWFIYNIGKQIYKRMH